MNERENIGISSENIQKFKELFQSRFNTTISDDMASELARNFMNLCKVVLKDNTPLDKEKNSIKLAS